ncbi:putative histone H3.v1 [Iris pallida]|uniref:Histone H3.v1 n=1 Tax=Iris pallida TaxID=29817 RepID=A0AAX6IM29_IRIPA|nr:putative histone H3.v1 [Iris pallida]
MSLQVHPPILVDAAATKPKLVAHVVQQQQRQQQQEEDAKSSDSSSAGSSDQEDHVDENDRKIKNGSFSSLSSLEESLPLKRGLSNYFSGKSRSFSNLSECGNADVGELAKPENPFNKRQRILTSLSRRASCSSIATAMPSLFSPQHAVKEEDEDEDEHEFEGTTVSSFILRRKLGNNNAAAFRPTSSFSDLQRV